MKTVWVKAHGGSNPSSCATQERDVLVAHPFLVLYTEFEEGFEGGSRFAGAKRFALCGWVMVKLMAKDDVDNVGAGRVTR